MVWIPLICAGSTSKNMFVLAEKVSCLSQGLGFSGQLDFAGGLQRVPGNMASHRQELLTFLLLRTPVLQTVLLLHQASPQHIQRCCHPREFPVFSK